MSNSKFLIVLAIGLIICLASIQSLAKNICQRPRNNFENLKHVNDYIECLKSQAITRYGKRANPSNFLAKLQPSDSYNDDDYQSSPEDLENLYNMLKYVEN